MTAPQPDDMPRPLDMSQRWRGWRLWLMLTLVVVILLAGLYVGVEVGGASNTTLANVCGQFSLSRRGLPCDIPLPSDATYIRTATEPYTQGVSETSWTYTTSLTEQQLWTMYDDQSASAWWLCGDGPIPGTFRITGGQNPSRPNTTLDVIAIPAGASAYKLTVGLIQSGQPFWSACA